MFRKIYISFFFCVMMMISSLGFSQKDSIAPLRYNPKLFRSLSAQTNNQNAAKISPTIALASLTLPFFDDFSGGGKGIYPDQTKWMDSNVYRNDTYPKAPV